jgi:mono/diheme cytochrome c family protein
MVIVAAVSVSTLLIAGLSAQSQKTIADGVYSDAQADRGEQRFKVSCSSCHTPGSFSGGAFAERWNGQTMGEVFDFVSNAMPENDPGGLEPAEYASVLAYILRVNGYAAGQDDLPADTTALKAFAIVPKK